MVWFRPSGQRLPTPGLPPPPAPRKTYTEPQNWANKPRKFTRLRTDASTLNCLETYAGASANCSDQNTNRVSQRFSAWCPRSGRLPPHSLAPIGVHPSGRGDRGRGSFWLRRRRAFWRASPSRAGTRFRPLRRTKLRCAVYALEAFEERTVRLRRRRLSGKPEPVFKKLTGKSEPRAGKGRRSGWSRFGRRDLREIVDETLSLIEQNETENEAKELGQ